MHLDADISAPPVVHKSVVHKSAQCAAKMKGAGLPALTVRLFQHYYQQLQAGATGYIDNAEARPVDTLPTSQSVAAYRAAGRAALDKAVVVKLNGGLGTSMGMSGPKSLLPVKNALRFLDIIVRQVLHLRHAHDVSLPLVFMNSFSTEADTLAALAAYPALQQAVPFSFLQNKVPKICKDSLLPATWSADPDKEWCPPGHGDLYAALLTSGMLDTLLDAGYEYIFVSNSDNLGATLDLDILGYVAHKKLPFLMEVAERTPADCKGGHLAQRPDGQLILRELAQCPPDEIDAFQNVRRYRYFNTNNLWLHLPTLRETLTARNGVLGLPLIRNEKPVDPTDPDSPRVYQLETAMGSAIGIFSGAQAIRVERNRFIPVKKNNDLLLLLSDVYRLTSDYRLELTTDKPPLIILDERYYKLIDDLRQRFPHGAPSLRQCTALHVQGDIRFGKNVMLAGDVKLSNRHEEPLRIADGEVIQESA